MKPPRAGFSLVEVVFALGIVSIATVTLMGVFPSGLQQSSASVLETRSVHLARLIFAELRTPPVPPLVPASLYTQAGAALPSALKTYGTQNPPFSAVSCFGQPLNLPTLDLAAAAAPPDISAPEVTLYADFPATASPSVFVSPPKTGPQPAYRIGLWFRKIPDAATPAATPAVMAYAVTLAVFPQGKASAGVEFQSLIGSY